MLFPPFSSLLSPLFFLRSLPHPLSPSFPHHTLPHEGSEEDTFIKCVSLQPKIFEVHNFLKTEESQAIVAAAKPHVAKSTVALKDADKVS
jgi:hypothetical protein